MKTFLTTLLIALSIHVSAQIKAVTEQGEEVILNTNGTWKYLKQTPSYTTTIDTQSFSKDKNATFLVKGTKIGYGVYIDPKKWRFKSDKEDNAAYEYQFTLKEGDAQAMIIPEKIELTMELMKMAALENGKQVAPDIHITHEEIRKVNGHVVTMLELRGTIKSLPFVYIGYYYVGEAGTIQFIAYTTEKLLNENRKEMETLLNGLVLLKE